MHGLEASDLCNGIATLRNLASLYDQGHNTMKSVAAQLNQLAGQMESHPTGDIWRIVTTLSQLRQYFSRTDISSVNVHGQCNEVPLLRKLLPNDPVVYVDVGACDPCANSNTWDFYQGGGHGLLIEPRPIKWYGLLSHRHRDSLFVDAVGDEPGIARMRMCNGASTIDPTWDVEDEHGLLVKIVPFQEVLDKYPQIRDACQLCTIDVEGFERRVLRSIDFSRFRPQVFCVEYATFDPFDSSASGDRSLEWAHILTDNGYREQARTALNAIYVREDMPMPDGVTK